jgi:hypothetical protein
LIIMWLRIDSMVSKIISKTISSKSVTVSRSLLTFSLAYGLSH